MKNMLRLSIKVSVVEDFSRGLKKSSAEWANKARWLMNSRNSLTNPITSDKLKCQRLPYVASQFLCCSVISPAADMCQHHMVVCRTVWEGHENRGTVTGDPGRCLSPSIDWVRRLLQPLTQAAGQAGLADTSALSPCVAERNCFQNLSRRTVT